MTPEEFQKAYLEAQNGLGNDLQTFISLSRRLSELATTFNQLAETISTDYSKMNAVVETFVTEQDNQSPTE